MLVETLNVCRAHHGDTRLEPSKVYIVGLTIVEVCRLEVVLVHECASLPYM